MVIPKFPNKAQLDHPVIHKILAKLFVSNFISFPIKAQLVQQWINHSHLPQVRSALHTVLRQKAPRDCLFILYDAPEALARDLDPDLRAYLKKCRKLDYRRDSMFWARLRWAPGMNLHVQCGATEFNSGNWSILYAVWEISFLILVWHLLSAAWKIHPFPV